MERAERMIRVTRETHETPAGIQERVARAGGWNIYGEANFRVVWGGSRLCWIGGRWVDHDASGNLIRETIELRRVPKYLPENRWHIERWMAAETYGTPDEWRELTTEVVDGVRVASLGPYPSRGDYEHCFTLSCAGGEFLQLTGAACDWVVRAIQWSGRQGRRVRREALVEREALRERRWDRRADDLLGDAGAVFDGADFVSL
jgi:hypothetical protein